MTFGEFNQLMTNRYQEEWINTPQPDKFVLFLYMSFYTKGN